MGWRSSFSEGNDMTSRELLLREIPLTPEPILMEVYHYLQYLKTQPRGDRFNGLAAKVQQVITTPEGEKRYWFTLEGGKAQLGMGEAPDKVDATITQDYDTAVALSKNELTGTAAYMSGKLRVSGDLMKLMQLQGALGQMPAALKDLDVDY